MEHHPARPEDLWLPRFLVLEPVFVVGPTTTNFRSSLKRNRHIINANIVSGQQFWKTIRRRQNDTKIFWNINVPKNKTQLFQQQIWGWDPNDSLGGTSKFLFLTMPSRDQAMYWRLFFCRNCKTFLYLKKLFFCCA